MRITDAAAVARLLGELGYPTGTEQVVARLRTMPDDFAGWVAEVRERAEPPELSELTESADGTVAVRGLAVGRTSWRLTDDRPVAQLVTLVTDPGHRGTGVGSLLLRACEHWAVGRGADRLLITSGLQRTAAHEWYRRRGYQDTGVRLSRVLPAP